MEHFHSGHPLTQVGETLNQVQHPEGEKRMQTDKGEGRTSAPLRR
jgi:hypothetical protein